MKNYLPSRTLLTLITGLMLCLISQAKETKVPNHQLSEWKLGDVIIGDPTSTENLKGKVVVIEYWGTK